MYVACILLSEGFEVGHWRLGFITLKDAGACWGSMRIATALRGSGQILEIKRSEDGATMRGGEIHVNRS